MNTYRTWESIRAERVASGLIDEDRLAELSEKMHAEVRAYRLADVRERLNVSQTLLAEQINVSQSHISGPQQAGHDDLVGEG